MQANEQRNSGRTATWPVIAAVIQLLAISACAQRPVSSQSDTPSNCIVILEAFDSAVAEAKVGWSGARRVQDFSYLRVDRFLASFRQASLSDVGLATWTERMRALDRSGREHEMRRLSAASIQELGPNPEDLLLRMETCAEQMRVADLARQERVEALRRSAVVADDYSLAQRTFGLYPITFMPVSEGIYRLQEQIRADFATELGKQPRTGRLLRYVPPGKLASGEPPVPRGYDPLGVPAHTEVELDTLFDVHAPIWEIDTVGAFDLPGAPYWERADMPAVKSDSPVSYRYHSLTRWKEQVLLQLNYLVWFDERPPRSSTDLLAGRLDGVVWRVTLRSDGRPLLYDSMHPCGCYHMFFPESVLIPKVPRHRAPEPPLIPDSAPPWDARARVVLRLASGSHYLQAVYQDPAATGQTYRFRDYAELYGIPGPDGKTRGLFSPNGLVPGSERAERWILWPMGVVSPGAMRGRGHHATAFVGRRHFDDPGLIESVFESGPVADPTI